MAGEAAYQGAARAMLDCPEIDALLVSAVPLTPALATTATEIADHESLAHVLARLAAATRKPIAAVIDSGPAYVPLVRQLRERGIPVFRSADQAMRSFGRYLAHRAGRTRPAVTTPTRTPAELAVGGV